MSNISESREQRFSLQEKRELLARSLQKGQKHLKIRPLSFAQQRLWFLDQLQPGNAFYHVPMALRLQGPVDRDALEKSLNALVKRHEVLRTMFPTLEGRGVQAILPYLVIKLPVTDMSSISQTLLDIELKRTIIAETKYPFDLSRGPLIRVILLRLTEQEHVLLVTVHHIVFDGWSQGIFFNELSALYNAFSADQAPSLPPLPIQYADFAAWQRQRLQGQYLDSLLSYWHQSLAHLPMLEMPADHPRPSMQSFRGARQPFTLSVALTQQFKMLCQSDNTTLYMGLLAAFQILLARYSGQEDIVVGSPIANRTREELEGLIGFFVNTLVMRTDLTGDPDFHSLLARVRDVALDAYAYQDLPFEKLVEELQPERSLGHNPLFQASFSLQNRPIANIKLSGLNVQTLSIEEEVIPFDLGLNLEEKSGELVGWLEYSTDLFEETTISQMAKHFQTLLQSIAAHPEQPISTLLLLTAAEQQFLLAAGTGPYLPVPQAPCLHQLFEAQVERTPHAIALSFADRHLTYDCLNCQANRLAHYLQQSSVGIDVPVGLCLERSLDLVIALLAIFKTGGCAVPLDPTYPANRLSFSLQDAQAHCVLTSTHLQHLFAQSSSQLFCLDVLQPVLLQRSPQNLSAPVQPEHLAYMIYTSGTTGQPKAVQVEHRNICNILVTSALYFSLSALDVMPALASAAFDISLFELLMPLLVGARVLLLTREDVLELESLLDQLTYCTLLHMVPSLMRVMVDALSGSEQSSLIPLYLRVIFTGGDAVPPVLLEQMRALFPQAQLRVLYGPTEGTIICANYLVPAQGSLSRQIIGRPLPNQSLSLRDAHRQQVAVGIPGEIYLGGSGVTRGYHNRVSVTQERYVVIEGERWYRTGDRGRMLSDGNIEFLGRVDNQIKIRGFRIEPGEIEVVLTQHPMIRQAVVIAREDRHGEKLLVAYVVLQQHIPLEVDKIRQHLRAKLPEHMLPAAFVPLEALPLTANNKVDRLRLPAPSTKEGSARRGTQTEIQELVANTYAQLLGKDAVGSDDNFFLLGGHSLLATQVVTRLRSILHIDLPLRSLFEMPTVASLAKYIEEIRIRATSANLSYEPISRIERVTELDLSFAQKRLWFLDQLQPNSSFYHIPMALHLSGVLNVSALEQSIHALLQRHEILRTSFASHGQRTVQIIAPTLVIPFSCLDLRGLPPTQREAQFWHLYQHASYLPFDLTQGPLFRAMLFRLTEQEHIFFMNVHHILFDGWSQEVFFRELSECYNAFQQGDTSSLPPLPIQYADFVIWQQRYLQGQYLDVLLQYWHHRLAELPLLELPLDHPRPAIQSFRGLRVPLSLPTSLTQQLRVLSQQEEVTLFMCLLAAFQILLARYSGQEDIVVGTLIANRTRTELEGLIGFFVNTLVLRSDLAGEPNFREVVARVREVALGAYAHQDLPFEKLVEELQPERSLSYNPLFQVSFALQKRPLDAITLRGIQVQQREPKLDTTKFDLSLDLEEQPSGEISGWFHYSRDLFEAATISRMAEHWQILLQGIVANPEQPVTAITLFSETERERLSMLIKLNRTPQQPNGKVNRRQLSILHPPEQINQETVPPDKLSQIEETLTYIWRELLQSDQVGRDDNFFDLGGHSLLVLKLREMLQEHLNRKIPVVTIFQYPTIHALANYLQEEKDKIDAKRYQVKPKKERRDIMKKHRADSQK